jgi:hypothetical protein
MASAPIGPDASRRLLELARADREAAAASLAKLSEDDQLAVVCSAPPAQRGALLRLCPAPEALIPRLPEAELVFTVKAVGLHDAGWILAAAAPEQIVAGLDLDAWRGHEIDTDTLGAWIASLAEADHEALVRAARALDPELLVVYLRSRVQVVQKPTDDPGWVPPEKAQTLEGQFYFVTKEEGEDAEALVALLRGLFQEDYWAYFRLMQGAIWELDSDTEEWALRWRAGRLQDLGFPPWEEAMGIYRFIATEDRARVPDAGGALDVDAWKLPVWLPDLPVAAPGGHRVFRAIAELGDDERRAAFYAFVAVANKVAVADRLPLSDAESTPRAIEKAARLISHGIAYVACERGFSDAELLRRLGLERLFGIGANLDPLGARP